MKKLYASALVLIMVISTAILLGSCSGNTGKTFSSQVTGEDVQIWFECQNNIDSSDEDTEYIIEDADDPKENAIYGRETRVIWIKVYKDGKLSSYSCLDTFNLGYFSKMTDEEILKDLEDTNKFACGQKEQPYKIYLYTDAAGQKVEFEGVPSRITSENVKEPMYFLTLISTATVPTFQVYDSYYGGFELYNYDETLFSEACLVTRCEKNDSFTLDSMELEDAVLDYKTPLELLAELNNTSEDNDAKVEKEDKSKDSEDSEEAEEASQTDKSEEAEKTDDAASETANDAETDNQN